ncbi:MAG: M1 family aminopeptidase [Bacteroidia bacterium]|jgi:aminopeptidase N
MKSFLLLFLLLISSVQGQSKILSDTPEVAVFPNPAVHFIDIQFEVDEEQSLNYKIYDLQGELRYSLSLTGVKGTNRQRIYLDQLNEGMYLLQVKGTAWIYTQKIFKLKGTERIDKADLLHTEISLQIRNLAQKSIEGSAKLAIYIKDSNPDSIRFDLLKLTVSAVKIDTVNLSFSQNDSQLTVLLPSGINQGDTLHFTIAYSGQPIADARWGGFFFNGNYAYNMGVGMASNPHSFGRCWFPCFDDFRERSTYSFHITTDSSWKAVCNGLKSPDSTHADGSTTWNWEIVQPIPAYLASVAVGKYEFVESIYTGLNGSIPILIAAEAKDTANVRKSFINLQAAMQCFESKFGPYPFDRIGFVAVPFNSGAMEHATNIAYPVYAIDGTLQFETLFAHELSHMWWGNQVTCRTEADMWLNEGWASYCESVFLECLYGESAYYQEIHQVQQDVNLNAPKRDKGWQPVSGIDSDITYGMHVYQKGALMVHNLRTLMGDEAFFTACKSYLNRYRFSDVSSEDLRHEFELHTTQNLLPFFQHWIYEKGQIDVDVVLVERVKSIIDSTYYNLYRIRENNRYKSGMTSDIPLTITLHLAKDSVRIINAWCYDGEGGFGFTDDLNYPLLYLTVNETEGFAFGKNTEKRKIGSTGSLSLSNVLLNLNVTQVNDTALLYIEHHWVPAPSLENLNQSGIRLSCDRYWTVRGILPETFTSMAFFNYDANPGIYLDEDFMRNLQTEDSLVLLFRPYGEKAWQVHTDHTFQPGVKTDKTGRFWVNKLRAGDYAFGIRDHTITGLNQDIESSQPALEVYPNPTGDRLWIKVKSGEIRQIEIISMDGRTLRIESSDGESTVNIATQNLLPGIYQIRVESDHGIYGARIVKL